MTLILHGLRASIRPGAIPFDSAIETGDRQRAIDLLLRVAMTEASGAQTVDTVLGNPAKYGYPRPT
jgi:hypothetical protein